MNARSQDPFDSADAAGWSASNQRWLSTQFARLRLRIGARLAPRGAAGAGAPAEPTATVWTGERPPALERMAHVFGLSPFESELLLLAAGVELDAGLHALLPSGLSFSLAMSLLGSEQVEPHWDALSPQAPLRAWQLVDVAGALPAHAPLTIAERALHALTGVAALEARLQGLASFAAATPDADARSARRLAEALHREAGEDAPLLLLASPADQGRPRLAAWRDTAAAAAALCGRAALLVAVEDVPADAQGAHELARGLAREALLSDAVVVLWGETAPVRTLALCADSLEAPAIVAAPIGPTLLRERLGRQLRVVDWCLPDAALDATPADAGALRAALQQFRVDAPTLRVALQRARAPDMPREQALWQALRDATRGALDALAQRIDSPTRLDDLVLPAGQLEQLRSIARQLRHRHLVHQDWGFAAAGRRGLGLAALFAGESGTGKTLAAEAIANEARLDLYRIDLAATVSKYIGETEKNLARVFDAAEASGAVLLFDEADALFGKRSEVKDSHDRYANIEIAYLLQRIESYRGLAILTTNMKGALDKAFLRRIRYVVQFPFPDEGLRQRLWRRELPAAAPCAAIDYAALARAPLAGGHIRSAALQAAFAAAARGTAIDTGLLTDALRAEFAKLERPLAGVHG